MSRISSCEAAKIRSRALLSSIWLKNDAILSASGFDIVVTAPGRGGDNRGHANDGQDTEAVFGNLEEECPSPLLVFPSCD